MNETPLHFRTDTRQPDPLPPPRSCDCQVHLVGDPERYPHRFPHGSPPPTDATFEAAQRLHRTLGIERGVIVNSLLYHGDNRILSDALKSSGGNYRGVAVFDESITDAELQRLHDVGVRGVRFHFWGNFDKAPRPDAFERIIARIGALGWHAKIHTIREDLLGIAEMIAKVKSVPVVIDHMAHVKPEGGLDQPVARTLLELLRRDNVWVMISCYERNSAMDESWTDFIPLAQAFIAAAPDRAIWATDWPHLSFPKTRMPNDAEILEALYAYAPDPEIRHKILVANPARLYDFPE